VPGFREMSAVLARRIPGAAYRVIAGAGHMVSLEQPAAVGELLTRFVLDSASSGGMSSSGASWSR
jgi:pimeloyl-ACP methyl ester carboxylesterase